MLLRPILPILRRRFSGRNLDTANSGDKMYTADNEEFDHRLLKAMYNCDTIVNVEQPPFNVRITDADATAKIQAIINLADPTKKTVVLLPNFYNSTSLDVPGYVDVIGLNPISSGLNRVPGKNGPMLKLIPYKGTSGAVRYKQQVKSILLDGNNVGCIVRSGDVTLNSNIITNLDSVADIQNGYLAEGYGIPSQSFVTSVGETSVTIGNVATSNNTRKKKLIFRKANTKIVSATVGSKIITAASVAGYEVGMRAFGSNLEDDPDTEYGLPTWTIILEVNPINNTLTLDRPAKASGTFNLTGFIGNDGILVVDVKHAANYNSTKEYETVNIEEVTVTQAGYHGIAARPGRDQVTIVRTKVASNQGFGYHQSACSDCKQDKLATGSNWYTNYFVGSSATPKFYNGEIWQTYLLDKYYDAQIRSVPEMYLSNADINGRISINGKADESIVIAMLNDINFKFTDTNLYEDGTSDYYINASRCVVTATNCVFKPDRQSGAKPNHLHRGKLLLIGSHFNTDVTSNECPYAVSQSFDDVDTILKIVAVHTDTMRSVNRSTKYVSIQNGETHTTNPSWDKVVLRRASGGVVSVYTIVLPDTAVIPDDYETPEYVFTVGVTTLTFSVAAGNTATIVNPPTTATPNLRIRFTYNKINNYWHIS